MSYSRGDIVEVYFDLPYQKETKLHPAIIISNQSVFEKDDVYICVMMTSSNRLDMFSFEITKDMLESKNNKVFSQARCHLVTYIQEKHILNQTKKNSLKESAVNRLVERINNVSICEDE